MGLDTSHDCWHGAYSAFMRWRTAIAEVAGFGNILDYDGFGGEKPWPVGHPLVPLLSHSDCDGQLDLHDLAPMADALEGLLPALRVKGAGGGHIGDYAEKTQEFVYGLRRAVDAGENVEFH